MLSFSETNITQINIKTKKETIPTNEANLASIYFTLSNMAILHLLRNPKNLESEYYNIDGIVQSETGYGLKDEFNYWKKEVKKAKKGDYVYDEWQVQREKYINN